ncbi:MAG: queuosine precursor transporter [Phycisphaerales bacterium]|nr:queuosine precursor transporter [Phycisphaerales bacterium]
MHHDAPLPSQQHTYPGLPALSEAVLHRRREHVFLVFAGLFLGSLAMLNILGISRFLDLSFTLPLVGWRIPMPLAIGVLPYPITFLCTDFISELYGRRRANLVVMVGFMLNLWVILVLWVGGLLPGGTIEASTGMPPLPQWSAEKQAYLDYDGWAFFQVRRLAFGAVAASMAAYLFAQFVDVQVFHFWKKLTNGRHLWLRNNGSTLISQLVDTVAVILITHYYAHALPVKGDEAIGPQLMAFIAAGYVFKMFSALLDTLPFYLGAHWLTRYLRLPPASGAPHPGAAAAVEAGVG